jgi:DNA-binding protein HU-beta
MNKADLIDLLASTHSLSKAESGRILETLLSTIVKTVKKGGSVGIAGFGAFKMQARSARGGYNPATRSKMKIPAVKVPKFTPGTAFRAEVDPRAAARKAAARVATVADSPAAGAGGVATKATAKSPAKKAASAAAKAPAKTPVKVAAKTAANAAAKPAENTAKNTPKQAAKKAPAKAAPAKPAARRG